MVRVINITPLIAGAKAGSTHRAFTRKTDDDMARHRVKFRGRISSNANSANREKKKKPSVVWFVYVETWGRAKKQMTEADS